MPSDYPARWCRIVAKSADKGRQAKFSGETLLKMSSDRKVANAVTAKGNPVMPNSFGIPAGLNYSCPGATSFCERICYAGRIERQYKNVSKNLISNFEQLVYADCLSGIDGMSELIHDMILRFDAECTKRDADKLSRIHWDGDFFSADYAKAWARVIREFPSIRFWVYTRSFTDTLNVLPFITGIDNFTVYLSGDPVNIQLANKRAAEFPGVLIATVADTFKEARETVDNTRKTYPCPENGKRIALISDTGSACKRCDICIVGRGDVLFSRTKH